MPTKQRKKPTMAKIHLLPDASDLRATGKWRQEPGMTCACIVITPELTRLHQFPTHAARSAAIKRFSLRSSHTIGAMITWSKVPPTPPLTPARKALLLELFGPEWETVQDAVDAHWQLEADFLGIAWRFRAAAVPPLTEAEIDAAVPVTAAQHDEVGNRVLRAAHADLAKRRELVQRTELAWDYHAAEFKRIFERDLRRYTRTGGFGGNFDLAQFTIDHPRVGVISLKDHIAAKYGAAAALMIEELIMPPPMAELQARIRAREPDYVKK